MAEFKEISPAAPTSAKLLNWVDNRFPLSKLYNEHVASTTRRRTSTSGTSSARWRCWCW
jgi:hypothetical protein